MQAELCDMCLADGDRRLAVAVYWNKEGDEWHCCAKHLKDVKTVGLEYEPLKEEGKGKVYEDLIEAEPPLRRLASHPDEELARLASEALLLLNDMWVRRDSWILEMCPEARPLMGKDRE